MGSDPTGSGGMCDTSRRQRLPYVQRDADLDAVARKVRDEPLLAVDTEAAGYHRYHDRVCLVQLSTRSETYVIDALAVSGLAPLRDLLANPATEIVFHDAEYDLRLLARDYDMHVAGLFDTKVAAQFAGEPAIGLANLVEKHLDIRLDKKFQRADWAHRPLPRDQLEYAAEDTRHLPRLRDRLREALVSLGRLHWAQEEFRLREEERPAPAEADPDAYMRLKNTRDLGPRQLAALRELHQWRERTAEEKDVAPFRVLGNDALVSVARAMPDSPAALARVPGLPSSIQARRGDVLVESVLRAKSLPTAELPERPRGGRRPAPDAAFDARVERLKKERDRIADALGLDRGFLMPRQQLEQIARAEPANIEELAALPDMRKWQVEAMGAKLLKAL